MAGHRIPVAFHFKVEVGGAADDEDIRFQEASGLGAEIGLEELREGGLNEYVHRLPTGAKYGNLVLKRGYVKDSGLASWCRDAIESFAFEPRDVQVTLLDENHAPLAAWSFAGAYPVKWRLADLKAQDNALAIETLELAYRTARLV